MAHEQSPSSVMYGEFKALGLKNRDVALVLLDADRSFGGSTMRDRIESRSLLSRAIVHVAPGEVDRGLFKDFFQSVPALTGQLISKGHSSRELVDRFSGGSAEAMLAALRAYAIDESMYRNALAHIANLAGTSDADRALLLVMLFAVAGCTGDPRQAAIAVDRFASERVGEAFRTTQASVGLEAEAESGGEGDDFELGLMRIVGGKLKGVGAFHRITPDEQGSEIGTLATGPGAITDVDEDVSRHHARVYKQNGRYYIIGLKSTNGTTVISGDDKVERVVEPPKRERPRAYKPEPHEILPTDTICLGASTRFMVLPLMPE